MDSPRPAALVDVVRQLTPLQIDPTAAIAPSADLVVWSRLGSSCSPADLTTALEDRTLLELRAMIRPGEEGVPLRTFGAGRHGHQRRYPQNMCGAPAEPPHLPPAPGEQVPLHRAEVASEEAPDPRSTGRRSPDVDVLVLTPADWSQLKSVRLRALQESPHAFASAYQHEARWSEDEWRSTFDTSLWLAAGTRHDLIGLARSTSAERAWQRNVESVWVQPDRRRRGVTRMMLQKLIEHEPGGVTELYAWVLDGNDAARRVYQRLGFVFTGLRQPLPGSMGRMEERLVLRIGRDRGRG